jgi:MerR family transcriptional regulator, mercuric resistance operon regulatory protein
MQRLIRIQGAAAELGVSEATIRRYERKGLIEEAARNRAGHRIYSEQNIQTIRRVLYPSRKEA